MQQRPGILGIHRAGGSLNKWWMFTAIRSEHLRADDSPAADAVVYNLTSHSHGKEGEHWIHSNIHVTVTPPHPNHQLTKYDVRYCKDILLAFILIGVDATAE